MIGRRQFLGLLSAPLALRAAEASILVHEHILVDFIGADGVSRSRYDASQVVAAAKPRLDEIKRLGCRRLQECTPNYLGRDPKLLRRLEHETGLEIWTNTGLYGAGKDFQFLPAYARAERPEQLAMRWIREAKQGVEGVKPRFIKIGVSGQSPLHELDLKLVAAAAITSIETGLTIASHTPNGAAALAQLEVLSGRNVDLSKFVWVHAQNEKDHRIHEQAARAGAWVEFDGVGTKTAQWHQECLTFMSEKGLLGKTLLSQDSGWYHVGEEGGGDYSPYSYIYMHFLPGMPDKWVRMLMWENPRNAFG
jgi:phosphotriesterase-related protein